MDTSHRTGSPEKAKVLTIPNSELETSRPIAVRTLGRFVRFSTVGALGLAVKFGVLILMKSVFGLGYLLATTIAVEAAIIHNFVWHSRWTWRDRSRQLTTRDIFLRLLRLHLTSGAVAMATNLLVMRLAVGEAGLHYILANALATIAASSVNFLLANWLVYVPPADPRSPDVR